MVGKAVARPPNLEGWIRETPAALETLRILLERPGGNRVNELERRGGNPHEVVRTLNQLQNAGLVKINVEALTHELVARVPERKVDDLKILLDKLREEGSKLHEELGHGAKGFRAQ